MPTKTVPPTSYSTNTPKNEPNMTTYRILTPAFVGTIVASGDLVVQAAPSLHWAVGGTFSAAREYFTRRGWQIEPLLLDTHPEWIEHAGCMYEFQWKGDTITRITKHVDGEARDITFDELPDELGGIL